MPIVPSGWDWQIDWHENKGYWVPEGWEFQPDYSFLARTNWGYKERFDKHTLLRELELEKPIYSSELRFQRRNFGLLPPPPVRIMNSPRPSSVASLPDLRKIRDLLGQYSLIEEGGAYFN